MKKLIFIFVLISQCFGAEVVVKKDYPLDLNGDEINEVVWIEKRDGVDWLSITDAKNKTLIEERLDTAGGGSHVGRMNLMTFAPNWRVLVVYFWDGFTGVSKKNLQGRLCLVTIKEDKEVNVKFTKGPYFLKEQEFFPDSVVFRANPVRLEDLNGDGYAEIVLGDDRSSRVFYFHHKSQDWTQVL